MMTTCSWGVVRGGIEEPCDKPAVAWSLDPREEFAYCDPFPVCAAHAFVKSALPLDDPQRPLSDALQPCRCVWDCKHMWCGCAVHA